MKLESDGILIGLRPLGERDVIVKIFTCDYGVVSGVIRAGLVAKHNKPLVGQFGQAIWVARLDTQLGAFHWDVNYNMLAKIIDKPDSLMLMNSAFSLIDILIPEREEYKQLYADTMNMLHTLGTENEKYAYLNWEIALLSHLGYAMDLSHCSGCGTTDNLHYISPRTSRAVCEKCAQPYLDKLYKLPVNLNTTLRFLESICLQQGVCLPYFRCCIKNIA